MDYEPGNEDHQDQWMEANHPGIPAVRPDVTSTASKRNYASNIKDTADRQTEQGNNNMSAIPAPNTSADAERSIRGVAAARTEGAAQLDSAQTNYAKYNKLKKGN